MWRLAALLVCVGLGTSRLGLVLHELIGHGATALAYGHDVAAVRLFTFAGGWVRYDLASRDGLLAMSLGGIVLEAVMGLALWIGLTLRDALGARIVRAIGAALVIHASWYLAVGTWHGFGDGVALHRRLGDDRWVVAIPAALACCAFAFAGARLVLGPLAATLPGSRGRRIAGTVIALALAGGVQVGLALGEVALRRDTSYATVMRPERDKRIASELARWEEQQVRDGRAPDAAARRDMQQQLARRHQTFPLAAVLGVLVLVAIALGAWRTRAGDVTSISDRLLVRAAVVASGSIALVVALDAWFL